MPTNDSAPIDEPHTGSDKAAPGHDGPQADSAPDGGTQGPTSALPSTEELYRRIHGPGPGYICTVSLLRGKDGKVDEQGTVQQFHAYPSSLGSVAKALQRESRGRDLYLAAHLFSATKRSKSTTLPLRTLYADLNTALIPEGELRPSVTIETSPGRLHAFWLLDRPLDPDVVEQPNKRLTLAIGADKSGYDLTQNPATPGERRTTSTTRRPRCVCSSTTAAS